MLLLDELSARLGIVLREPDLIGQAFVHSSFYNENPERVSGHNERLEFYGDAVIGVAVSRLLFERYPDEDEGFLPPVAPRSSTARRSPDGARARTGSPPSARPRRDRRRRRDATLPSCRVLRGSCWCPLAVRGHRAREAVLESLFATRLEALSDTIGPPKSAKSRLRSGASASAA